MFKGMVGYNQSSQGYPFKGRNWAESGNAQNV